MSKFLLPIFIQKTSGFQLVIHGIPEMSKRNSLHKAPKFKPEIKVVGTRSKSSIAMTPRKEKVEVLPEPIKSLADKKLYK